MADSKSSVAPSKRKRNEIELRCGTLLRRGSSVWRLWQCSEEGQGRKVWESLWPKVLIQKAYHPREVLFGEPLVNVAVAGL